jgi:hypothetical protein
MARVFQELSPIRVVGGVKKRGNPRSRAWKSTGEAGSSVQMNTI